MKRINIAIVIILIIIAIPLGLYISFTVGEWQIKHRGEQIAKQVEAFKHKHGILPDSLQQIGYATEDELYYQKRSNDTYMIFYGTSLGESEIYYSDSKKWEDVAR